MGKEGMKELHQFFDSVAPCNLFISSIGIFVMFSQFPIFPTV